MLLLKFGAEGMEMRKKRNVQLSEEELRYA